MSLAYVKPRLSDAGGSLLVSIAEALPATPAMAASKSRENGFIWSLVLKCETNQLKVKRKQNPGTNPTCGAIAATPPHGFSEVLKPGPPVFPRAIQTGRGRLVPWPNTECK